MNIVLFDGICNLCSSSVRFITRYDKSGRIRFAPLQSDEANQLLQNMSCSHNVLNSIIFISNEKIFFKSDAAIEIAKLLSGFPHYLKYFKFIPRPFRDLVYDLIAKNRYRLFGKSCSIQPSNHNK